MGSTSTRAQYVKPGDRIRWGGGCYKVTNVTLSTTDDCVRITVFGRVQDILYFAQDRVIIERKRGCAPCYDSDCDCIWDMVP